MDLVGLLLNLSSLGKLLSADLFFFMYCLPGELGLLLTDLDLLLGGDIFLLSELVLLVGGDLGLITDPLSNISNHGVSKAICSWG